MRIRTAVTWAGAGLFCATVSSYAQVVPQSAQSGKIEQRFVRPAPPLAKLGVPQGLESTVPPDQAAQIFLRVKNIHFIGNTVFSESELAKLAASVKGKRVSLKDVFAVAAAVTTKYGQAGYTLSRATVPPQELDPNGASITIGVVEGYIDQVEWPKEVENYRDLFSGYSAKITAERPIRVQTIERYLLLANDLPGLTFTSQLKPSAKNAGASTLVVSLQKEKHFSGSIGFDNRGSEASGPFEGNAQLELANIFHAHDDFTFGYTIAGPQLNSLTPELHYVNWGYKQVVNSEGLKFGFNGNASWGAPGTDTLLLLNYRTNSLNLSADVSYPFIRTRDTNLTGTLAFDWKNSESSILGVDNSLDRLRIVRGELAFDHADTARGVNQIVFSVSQGLQGLGSTENGNPLASRSNGRVDFTKANLRMSRNQDLGHDFSALVQGEAQLAAVPLLSSQECGYGGAGIGRGFDASILSGEHCLNGLIELRYDAQADRLGLQKLQPYIFADYGSVWNMDVPLGTAAYDQGASVGGGIRAQWKNFTAELQGTYQVVKPTSVSTGSTFGFFFDLSARF